MSEEPLGKEEALALVIVFAVFGYAAGFKSGYWVGKRDMLHAYNSAQRITHQE